MLNALQAVIAAPTTPRPDFEFPGRTPSVPFPDWEAPAERELPDRLAWRNDHEDNDDENFPGAGWDDPDGFEPDADDIAALHAIAPNDHDGQLDPNDIAYWSVPEIEYWDREYERWAEEEAHELAMHNAEMEGYGRFPLGGFGANYQ